MSAKKETYSGTPAADKGKNWTGTENRSAATTTTPANMEICHGSVCLGTQKPTHCICPTTKQ
jgi:hypothetical protein